MLLSYICNNLSVYDYYLHIFTRHAPAEATPLAAIESPDSGLHYSQQDSPSLPTGHTVIKARPLHSANIVIYGVGEWKWRRDPDAQCKENKRFNATGRNRGHKPGNQIYHSTKTEG